MSNPPLPETPATFGPEEFQQATGVSRETLGMLKLYAGMLADSPHNLVAASSLPLLWHRHMLDSAQLVPLIPQKARTLADMGSGAGFPGLVLAVLLRDRLKVTLFEATRKKAEFLATVAKRLDLPVVVRNERMEAVKPQGFDVVTARACAPLPELLSYAQNFQRPGAICLFLKGQNVVGELTEARKFWKMKLQTHPSQTHPLGVVLEIRDLVHG